MTSNRHYSATCSLDYSPERNCFILSIVDRLTNRLLVNTAFTRVEYINFIREALREYEDNLGEPFPFQPWYEQNPQEEETGRVN